MTAIALVKFTNSEEPAKPKRTRTPKSVDLLDLERQAQQVREARLAETILLIDRAIASADILSRSLDPITRTKGARLHQGLNVLRNEAKR